MVKKLFAVMCCLTILTSMVFAGGESEKAPADGKLALKVGTTTAPDGHYVKGLEEFKRLLAEYSGASITLDIYPNSQLGNERDLLEGVSLGTVPMALISTGPFPNFFPDFGVLDLPYLFPTPQIAYKALDGEIGTALLAQLDGKGIKGLGFFENGFRHVTNSKREIKVPADLKGLKIRTMENDIHMNTYQHYGASPTPMAWSEIFTALQQGTVDGQENPTIIIETAKVYEAQKYMSLTGNFYSPCVLIINKALFDKLPKAQQDIVVRAAQEAKVWQRNYSQNYEAEALKKIKSAGTVVTEVDINVWAAASQDTYKDFADKLRQDYIQKIRAAK